MFCINLCALNVEREEINVMIICIPRSDCVLTGFYLGKQCVYNFDLLVCSHIFEWFIRNIWCYDISRRKIIKFGFYVSTSRPIFWQAKQVNGYIASNWTIHSVRIVMLPPLLYLLEISVPTQTRQPQALVGIQNLIGLLRLIKTDSLRKSALKPSIPLTGWSIAVPENPSF